MHLAALSKRKRLQEGKVKGAKTTMSAKEMEPHNI